MFAMIEISVFEETNFSFWLRNCSTQKLSTVSKNCATYLELYHNTKNPK